MTDTNGIVDLRHAIKTRPRIVDDMMRRQNVVAVGVGFKITRQQQTGEPSLVVSVTQKQPLTSLVAEDVVPPVVEGMLTDVVETGPIVAHGISRGERLRPARPGISIGHHQTTAGTLGCLVQRSGEVFILSNNHVLALINRAQPGDPILQPGPADGGTLRDKIAELAEFVPLRSPDDHSELATDSESVTAEPEGCAALIAQVLSLRKLSTARGTLTSRPTINYADAALARPTEPTIVDSSIVDIGIPTGTGEATLGLHIFKSGRTTRLTEGYIIQVDVTAEVLYGNLRLRFVDQVMTTPLSRPGDSGSVVADTERRIIGLLFSGSDYVSVFAPIQNVLKLLRVELITEA